MIIELNEAKKATDGGVYWDASHMAYVLYGIPWLTYQDQNSVSKTDPIAMSATGLNLTPKSVNTTSIGNDHIKDINIDINENDYVVNQIDEFQIIEVQNFNKVYTQDELVLPIKRIFVNLPKDTTINSVTINGSNEVDLGNLNIPIYNDHPDITGVPRTEPMYSIAPVSLGLVDFIANVPWYDFKSINSTTVAIDIIPITHDAETKASKLYKNLIVNISYSTIQSGVLVDASTERGAYSVGDNVSATISIENTGTGDQFFNVYGKIIDSFDNEILTQSSSVTVSEGDIGKINLFFGTIDKPGHYFLITTVEDSVGEIGSQKSSFSVSSIQIKNFTVPNTLSPGESVNFSVNFENKGDRSTDVTSKIKFYNNNNFIGETIPIVVKSNPYTTDTANFLWDVPTDFYGEFQAVAIVTFEDGYDSLSNTLTIAYQGDIDLDKDVDRDDLMILLNYRNQPAENFPACDLDGDGIITGLDSRILVNKCTRPRCACE